MTSSNFTRAGKRSSGKMIVVLLADTGERYITTSLFAQEDDSNAAVG
jgi:hypothetical protein